MDEMNTNKDSFEASMQGMFSGMESNADEFVWQNIEAALQPNSDRALAWWWWTGAASIIVIAIFSVGLFDIESSYDARLRTFATSNDVFLENCDELDAEKTQLNELSPQISSSQSLFVLSSSKPAKQEGGNLLIETHAPSNKAVANGELASESFLGKENEDIYEEKDPILLMRKANLNANWDTCLVSYREEDVLMVFDDSDVDWQDWDEKRISDWGLAANLGSSNSSEQTGGGFGIQSDGFDAQENVTTIGLSDQRTIQELTYLSPFVIGVRGNWQFSKRLSLEIGLSYSLLPTNGESISGGVKRVNRYADHFVGAALLLNLSIIDRKKFGLYTSQGVLIEKGVFSRNILTTYAGNEEQSKQISKGKAQGMQLGPSFGLGAEYRINQTWSLFVETRVTSWLVNVNVQKNIRNQQVVWPTLDLGVRLNLQ
jgi:hypothetical protein